MAIVYIRRLKKGGYLGEGNKSSGAREGTMADFTKLFGNN